MMTLHIASLEFRSHLHVVIENVPSQLALSVFCQPNDQVTARVWRENLGKINLAEGNRVIILFPQLNLWK